MSVPLGSRAYDPGVNSGGLAGALRILPDRAGGPNDHDLSRRSCGARAAGGTSTASHAAMNYSHSDGTSQIGPVAPYLLL